MVPILLFVFLVFVCARLAMGKAETPAVMGWLLVLAGIAVFAIRLQHEGPYAPPEEGNLRGALLALVLGVGLSMHWHARQGPIRLLVRIALGASPIVLFFALYSTLAEIEEVVVLRAPQPTGETKDLRLWIVDIDGAEWVTMPGSKASANAIIDTRVELLRDGEFRCVQTTRHTDRETVTRSHREAHRKYAVQRLATWMGIFDETPKDGIVTIELTACETP